MTAQTRALLKGKFENGDKPQGSDYTDLIDSFLSIADTSAQSVAGHVTFDGGMAATTVSADTVRASAGAFNLVRTDVITVSGSVSAATVNAVSVTAANASLTSIVFTSAAGTRLEATTVSAATLSGAALTLTMAATAAASVGTGGPTPASADGFFPITVSGAVRYVPFYRVK